MKVWGTREWGAMPRQLVVLPTHRAQGIVIHHTAGANRRYWGDDLEFERDKGFQVARDIQRYHVQVKGWQDTGYHFIVTRGGLILEGRTGSLAEAKKGQVIRGAHSGSEIANSDYWGVVLEGNYDAERPTPEQMVATIWLCAQLSIWGGTQASEITGHRDWHPTSCPGECLYRLLEDLRRASRTKKLSMLKLGAKG